MDASVVVKLLVEEEWSDTAAALLDEVLIAPDVMGTECANALWRKTRRGILLPHEALDRLARLAILPIRMLPVARLLAGGLSRALRLGHPIYDCLYLEAASQAGLPLVTDDRRLARLGDEGAAVVLLADLAAS